MSPPLLALPPSQLSQDWVPGRAGTLHFIFIFARNPGPPGTSLTRDGLAWRRTVCPQGSSVGSIVEEILWSLPHFSLSVNVKGGPAGLEALVCPRHVKEHWLPHSLPAAA